MKYRGIPSHSKLCNLIKLPLKIDKQTMDKMGSGYTRLVVDIDIKNILPNELIS